MRSLQAEIGDGAGMIWQHLDMHGQTTLGRLDKVRLSE